MKNIIPTIILMAFLFSSCQSSPDTHLSSFKLAQENLKIAEQSQSVDDIEKYYTQALANYYKYLTLSDNSTSTGAEMLELEPDDTDTIIEAKIKAKKCIGILTDKFGRRIMYPGQGQILISK